MTIHRQGRRCEAEGLRCPQEVSAQLFHEKANDEVFAVIVHSVDWGRVSWESREMSGVALRDVSVEREYHQSFDEASFSFYRVAFSAGAFRARLATPGSIPKRVRREITTLQNAS